MRVRALTPTGDYAFGSSQLNFLVNSPAAVAQVVETTLRLWLGEWYLDTTIGTPYVEGVLGKHSQAQADSTLISIITGVQGVLSIQNFQSVIDPVTRTYSEVGGTLDTIYGETQLQIQNLGNL